MPFFYVVAACAMITPESSINHHICHPATHMHAYRNIEHMCVCVVSVGFRKTLLWMFRVVMHHPVCAYDLIVFEMFGFMLCLHRKCLCTGVQHVLAFVCVYISLYWHSI